MKNRRIAALLMSSLLLVLTACAGASPTTAPQPAIPIPVPVSVVPATPAPLPYPDIVTVSTYPVGGSGHAHMAFIGDAVKQKLNVSFRLLSAGTDKSRLSPVRDGKAELTVLGSSQDLAFEGMLDFAEQGWGPQRLRAIAAPLNVGGHSLLTAADSGIKTPYDLKGKKVPRMVGDPGVNRTIEGFLAFGNLTWNDVTVVDFPGSAQALDALVQGKVDVMQAAGNSPVGQKMIAAKKGVDVVRLPHSDAAGWGRLQDLAPRLVPYKSQLVTGHPEYKENPVEVSTWSYPLVATYADLKTDTAYVLTRLFIEAYPHYKDANPGLAGWDVTKWILKVPVPWHEGSVRYLKEAKLWTADVDAHQQRLLKVEAALQSAWAEFAKKGITDKDEAATQWQERRNEAMSKVGN